MNTTPFDPARALCPHCAGTGLCLHATLATDHSHQWLQCDTCGKGVPAVIDLDFDPQAHRPVCAACAGSGFLRRHYHDTAPAGA